MVAVQQVSLRIADGSMHPGKLFSRILGLYCLRGVFPDYLIEFTVTGEVVRFNPRIRIKTIFSYGLDCIRCKVLHHTHLKVLTRIRWSALFASFRGFGFRHYQNRRSVLTATTPFKFLLSFASIVRLNCGKEPLIHFSQSRKSILFIPSSHGNTDLLHHIPDWFIAFMPQLALDFFRRKSFLCGSHQMHNQEPDSERKVGGLHYRATSESGPGPTFFTLKLLYVFHPIVLCAFAFSAYDSDFQTIIPERILAGLLVGILLNKLYKLHIHYFESKLEVEAVTYLWFDI